MMTIEDIFKQLSATDRVVLMVALESGDPGYIEWSPHRFLGINIDGVPHLITEQSSGYWREGRIA